MSNLTFALFNHFDEAILTVTSGTMVATLPLANAQTRRRDLVARTSSAPSTAWTIRGTFTGGTSRKASHFGIYNHLLQGASYRHKLFTDAAWATLAYDSTLLPTAQNLSLVDTWGMDPALAQNTDLEYWEQDTFLWHAPITYASFEITISGTPGAYGYFQAGRFFIGHLFEVAINPAYGLSLSDPRSSTRARSIGAVLGATDAPTYRRLALDLAYMNENDRAAMRSLVRKCGSSIDLVVSVYRGAGGRLERDHTFNGRFAPGSEEQLASNLSWHARKLTLEEN